MPIKEIREDKIVVKRSTIERLYDLVAMPDPERLRIAADMLDALLNTASRSYLQDAMRTVYRSYVDAVAAGDEERIQRCKDMYNLLDNSYL